MRSWSVRSRREDRDNGHFGDLAGEVAASFPSARDLDGSREDDRLDRINQSGAVAFGGIVDSRCDVNETRISCSTADATACCILSLSLISCFSARHATCPRLEQRFEVFEEYQLFSRYRVFFPSSLLLYLTRRVLTV